MTVEGLSSEFHSIQPAKWQRVRGAPSISEPNPTVPSRISEVYLTALATVVPERLLEWIDDGHLDGADTALAVEVAARSIPVHIVMPTLLRALNHRSPIVREATILALGERALDRRIVRTAIEQHARSEFESSPAVRETAADLLAVRGE